MGRLGRWGAVFSAIYLQARQGVGKLDDVPVFYAVEPNNDAAAGGGTIVITGRNLIGATSVQFDTDDAASFSVDSDNQITAVTAPHGAGNTTVTVTTPYGTTSSMFVFT